jgi:hypothetical protein
VSAVALDASWTLSFLPKRRVFASEWQSVFGFGRHRFCSRRVTCLHLDVQTLHPKPRKHAGTAFTR